MITKEMMLNIRESDRELRLLKINLGLLKKSCNKKEISILILQEKNN